MKKLLFALSLFICAGVFAQSPKFYLNNQLKFVDENNDTIPYPFIGGFVSPQFSDIDLNMDGIKDLFVFDRSGNKKMTFINKGTANQVAYVYAPKYEYYFPELSNWVLLRDYNCDGLEDIFTGSEQSGYTVYKNISTKDSIKFKHIVYDLTDTTGGNMYCLVTDVPAIDDIDGDGDLDILAFGVLGGYVQYYRNERVEKHLDCDELNFNFIDFCWGSFQEASLSNAIYLGDNCFGLKFYTNNAHSGSTLLTFDVDADGDKDMLVGDVGYPEFKFLINGKVETSWPWDTVTSFTTGYPNNTLGVYIDIFPASFYLDVNNDGKKDLLASSDDPNTASNLGQNWWYSNSGQNNKPTFNFEDSSFLQNMTIDFGSQTAPALFDVDGDGDLDLLLANRGNFRDTRNANDRMALFENVGNSTKAIFKYKEGDYLNFSNDSIPGMYPAFVDLNDDGMLDLVIGDLYGELHYYQNSGTKSQPAFTLINDTLGSIDVGNYAAPFFYDIDKDGAMDMIMGNSMGTIQLYRNLGSKTNPIFASQPTEDSIGHINVSDFFYNYDNWDSLGNPTDSTKHFDYTGHSSPWIADLNKDGHEEIVVGSKGGKIFIFPFDKLHLHDSFPSITDYFIQPNNHSGGIVDLGGKTTLALADLSGDGYLDILIGNSRGGIEYLGSEYDGSDSATFIDPVLPSVDVNLFPNPSNGNINLRQDEPLNSDFQIEVLDVLGRRLMRSTWNPSQESTKQINMGGLTNGTYFVILKNPEYRTTSFRVTLVR